MTIDIKDIKHEDLIKLYEDKCKYCDVLEERLVNSNKRNDELSERINHVLIKAQKIKTDYKKLYSFAEDLCNKIDERDKMIKDLVEVNEGLTGVNKKMEEAVTKDIQLMITASQLLKMI